MLRTGWAVARRTTLVLPVGQPLHPDRFGGHWHTKVTDRAGWRPLERGHIAIILVTAEAGGVEHRGKPARPDFVTRRQWYWWMFISYTRLRELLFWLDASVPGFRGRLHRLHSPWEDPSPKRARPVRSEGAQRAFERYTSRARRTIVLAQEESRMLHHNYIGTEHLLLGILHEAEGGAARTLNSRGVTLEAVREQLRELVGQGQENPAGHIPFTPRAKTVLELSVSEAEGYGSNTVDAEHMLLGLLRGREDVGTQILARLGVNIGELREQVLTQLPGPATRRDTGGRRWRRQTSDEHSAQAEVARLSAENERLREELRRHGIDPDS